jgi:hypothetical protein
MSEVETAFDLCSICKNQGTDECGRCEVPHDLINLFQPDKNKVIVNPKVKLYAHWVNCIGEKCPEAKDKKCKQVFERINPETLEHLHVIDFVDLPKNGKCHDPCYVPYPQVDENSDGFERLTDEKEINDVPF